MVAVIATFTTAEGNAAAFADIAGALVAEVRANEPGCTLYKLARSRKDPNVFKFMEAYASKDDFKTHGATPYFQKAFSEMKPLLASDPVVEVLEDVA